MIGLGVLYASQATQELDWANLPDRDKVGRLREVYWIDQAESALRSKSFFGAQLHWRPDRGSLDRKADLPGDGFRFVLRLYPDQEATFGWLEVTEVFTVVPPEQIEAAMKARNGLLAKKVVDFEEFARGVDKSRPTRSQQRRAADCVISSVEKKLVKTSYREMIEPYGYGTLVVGLPLWFAVPPEDPRRAENALDDFATRVLLGLEHLKDRFLVRDDCAFNRIVVVWDTTPEAWREWGKNGSSAYQDAADLSLENPMPAGRFFPFVSDRLDEAIRSTDLPPGRLPSIPLHLFVSADKRKSGSGPYPPLVEHLGNPLEQRSLGRDGLQEKIRHHLLEAVCKLNCFVRVHGPKGLARWIARRGSVPHVWRARALRHRARLLYRESRSRNEARARRRKHMA